MRAPGPVASALVRRVLVATAIAAALLLGALWGLGNAYGVGPLARGAPASWVWVAIARSSEGIVAQEIEAIDLAGGGRAVFGVGAPIVSLALSPDRRTLFVGTNDARVLEVDAIRGTVFGEIAILHPPPTTGDRRGALVRHLLPLADDRLVAVTNTAVDGSLAILDPQRRTEVASLTTPLLGSVGGRPGSTRQALFLPASETGGDVVYRLDPASLDVVARAHIATAQLRSQAAPSLAVLADGEALALSPFAMSLSRLELSERGLRVAHTGPLRAAAATAPAFFGDLAVAERHGMAHVCVSGGEGAERYVVALPDLLPRLVASECGRFAAGPEAIAYVVRTRPELRLLDPVTGGVMRTLMLAGLPVVALR